MRAQSYVHHAGGKPGPGGADQADPGQHEGPAEAIFNIDEGVSHVSPLGQAGLDTVYVVWWTVTARWTPLCTPGLMSEARAGSCWVLHGRPGPLQVEQWPFTARWTVLQAPGCVLSWWLRSALVAAQPFPGPSSAEQ